MAEKEEISGHPKNVLSAKFTELKNTYANQSFIQRTDDDVAVVFGETVLDAEGKVFVEFQNSIRMSHNHFEKFVTNCNATLEELGKNAKK